METNNRTKVYNVIILDKSGSMNSIAKQAVDGVNETMASIKREQELHPPSGQHHHASGIVQL